MPYDLVCFSHLRWDFVYQRPQHLLSRFARYRRVFFLEEPLVGESLAVRLQKRDGNVTVVTPIVPADLPVSCYPEYQREVLDGLLSEHSVTSFVSWYYTPMALRFSKHLRPLATAFDCMDELSMFDFAPPELVQLEAELLERADVVFTGGASLYEAKRSKHRNIHCFPSSVDVQHFSQARKSGRDPKDQASIAGPRLGYAGVIDERMDLPLIAGIAEAHPEWQLVMVGPVTKIEESQLPRAENIHYLGGKPYTELPSYLRGWDVGLLPFAMNRSTQFISPTKTPEYLAAGLAVASTPIRDVVRPYQELGLVQIGSTVDEFCSAIERALTDDAEARLAAADKYLSENSWDTTWKRMNQCLSNVVDETRLKKRAGVPVRRLPQRQLQPMRMES